MKKVDLNLLSSENLAQIQGGSGLLPSMTQELELTKNNKNTTPGCICEYLNANSLKNTNKAVFCSCECIW